MWTVSEAPDVLAGIGALLGGSAAMWGACSAHNALDAWRKERSSDLARRLASVVYEHRLSLHAIREPWPTQEERDSFEISGSGGLLGGAILLRRWQQSRDKLDEVNAVLAEGDLRWNGAATFAYEGVLEIEKSVFWKIDEIQSVERSIASSNSVSNTELAEKLDSLRNDFLDSYNGDALNVQINRAFDAMTSLLRNKI